MDPPRLAETIKQLKLNTSSRFFLTGQLNKFTWQFVLFKRFGFTGVINY